MKRKLKHKNRPGPMGEMNTTPLIDVMLVLLVMLIITIPIQLHSVDLNMPTGNPPPKLVEPEVVKIEVDERGAVSWNGEAMVDTAALESKMQVSAAAPVQPEIHLRPHSKAEYAKVAGVMAAAQRIGLTRLGIVGNERYAQ
jgi:biopolymer transport protein ExbD